MNRSAKAAGASLQSLVAALNTTKESTPGVYSCRNDDGAADVLYVDYGTGKVGLQINVSRGGCQPISNGKRSTQSSPTTDGLIDALLNGGSSTHIPAAGRYPDQCPSQPPTTDLSKPGRVHGYLIPRPETPTRLTVCAYNARQHSLWTAGTADAFAEPLSAMINSSAGTLKCTPRDPTETLVRLYFGYPGSSQAFELDASLGDCTTVGTGSGAAYVQLYAGNTIWALSGKSSSPPARGRPPPVRTTLRAATRTCPSDAPPSLVPTQPNASIQLAPDGAVSAVACTYRSVRSGYRLAHSTYITTRIKQLASALNDSQLISPLGATGSCVALPVYYAVILHYPSGGDVVVTTRSCGNVLSNGIAVGWLQHPDAFASLASGGR